MRLKDPDHMGVVRSLIADDSPTFKQVVDFLVRVEK
jgi:hypothetical protein